MVANSGAILSVMTRARRSVDGSAADAARKVEKDFRQVVSAPFPPASTPGTPPHLRTGKYADSIKAKATGSNGHVSRITVETTSLVGLWTEYGTYRNGRPYMLPRSHWRTRLPRIVARNVPDTIAKGILKAER